MITEIEKVLNLVNEMSDRVVALAKCAEQHSKHIDGLVDIVKRQIEILENFQQRVERLERDNRTN